MKRTILKKIYLMTIRYNFVSKLIGKYNLNNGYLKQENQ